MYTVSFTTYSWGFTIVPSLYMNNEHDQQADFNRKFTKYLYKFAETLDSGCLSAMDTAKTQVFNDTLGIYSTGSNVLNATLAQRDEVIGDLTPMMGANDFYGPLHLIGNSGLQSTILKLAEKGVYNSENKVIQYADKELHFTNRLSNAANKIATGYCAQEGSTGLVYRFEREAILGTSMDDGTAWGITTLPMLNTPVGTYYYQSSGDYSSIAGAASADMTRVRKDHFGFSVDVAYITSHNTDATTYASPILKFDIADA